MKRRSFICATSALSLSVPFGGNSEVQAAESNVAKLNSSSHNSYAINAEGVRFYSELLSTPSKVLVIADTHLFMDDKRGEPYRQYSGRMASAYNQTRHYQTGEPTNPEESFLNALETARKSKVDLLALVGDIFSFPSEAAIEWVREKLAEAAVPYLYVAGNHDWHYEGMEGPLNDLRSTWIEKRLKPLYQGNHPLMASHDIKGVRFLAIDNSNYQISPEQLEFFREQVNSKQPLVLMVHIPLYAPGRKIGFGCGHPKWGASADRSYKLERRPKWPEAGHSQATLDFHREVFNASNLLGVFAGHIHEPSVDVINGIPQFVTDANATGAFMKVEFTPPS